MAIEAQFDSHCDYCDAEIEEGDMIEKDDSYGWVHLDCKDDIDWERGHSI